MCTYACRSGREGEGEIGIEAERQNDRETHREEEIIFSF